MHYAGVKKGRLKWLYQELDSVVYLVLVGLIQVLGLPKDYPKFGT